MFFEYHWNIVTIQYLRSEDYFYAPIAQWRLANIPPSLVALTEHKNSRSSPVLNSYGIFR